MLGRLLKWALGLGLTLVVVVALAGAYLFSRAIPAASGHERLQGLRAEARVWRDGYGVPHIFAASPDDAARALGYVHASERLLQMETQRRVAAGRLAEILGADLVGVDRYMRTLGLYRLAESSLGALSPPYRARLDAYAEGVNAYLSTHGDALAPEFLILGDRPDRWTAADSLAIAKLMAVNSGHNYEREVLRAKAAAKLPPDQAALLFPGPPRGSPYTTAPALSKRSALDDPTARVGALTPFAHGASNSWAVAGARTVTGTPILANDIHLELGAPILWYLARLVTPDGLVQGGTIPGLPGVAVGQNEHIAWGLTTADIDTQDLFVETIDPADPARYLTAEGPAAFVARDETIHVKGAADVVVEVRATRHGPVLSDASPDLAKIAPPGKAIALAFTGLSDDDASVEALLRVDAASGWTDFREALRLYQTPTWHGMFASAAGDIGFISFGRVPRRRSGDGLAPADGASGAFDWTGTVPFGDMPEIRDPAAGFLFNANNSSAAPDKEPIFGRDYEETFRAQRLQQLFDAIDKHSLDTSAAMQADRLSLAALALLPFITSATPADERGRRALALLGAWDGVMDKDRPEPLIYSAVVYALHRVLIVERVGDAFADKGPFDVTTILSLLKDHPRWCDAPGKPDPDCRATTSRALAEGLELLVQRDGPDMSRWRWGTEHVSVLQHPVYKHIPLLAWVSDLSAPASGDFYTLDRGGGFAVPADRPFARTQGAGFRGLYDLGDPDKSRFMIATGESGHIFSAHYGDLNRLWREGGSITLAGSEAQLKAAGAQLLTLAP